MKHTVKNLFLVVMFGVMMTISSPLFAEHSGIDNAVDTTANLFRVHYEGVDSHLHELYLSGNSWLNFDITAATGAPNVATWSAIANAVDTTANLFRVHYAGVDSHLHEAYPSVTGWDDFDITAATGAPNVAVGSAIANAVDTTANLFRVHYMGVDSHLHEAYPFGNWYDFDITAAAGAPNVSAGSAIANAVDTTAPVSGALRQCGLTPA